MVDLDELRRAVDDAFVETGRGSTSWPDPYPDRSSIPEDAYSRLTNPARWRILGVRTDAWLIALVGAGLATVQADPAVTWRTRELPIISRAERLRPTAAGALELVVAHSRIGDVGDAGVVLGVGDPAELVNWFPDCGCDACDSGSQNELEWLDTNIVGIVTGAFRRLTAGPMVITVIDGDGSWSADGFHSGARRIGRKVDDILADPRGWDELSGRSWLEAPDQRSGRDSSDGQ
jgi:hypothetical protein